MITNSLIELLQDNECVIVPEFGAFISKRHSATIDYANETKKDVRLVSIKQIG